MTNLITGMMKVLKKNYLITNSNTISVTSGSGTISNIYDLNKATRWQSSGASDIVTEIIEIEFNSAVAINAMAFLNFNWKEFQAFYDSGGAWTEFEGVYSDEGFIIGDVYGTGIYGSASYGMTDKLKYTDNSRDSRYFEFTEVSSLTKIRIETTATQTANQEKSLYELYIGKTIGTFTEDLACYPNSYEAISRYTNNSVLEKSNGGSVRIEKSDKYRSVLSIRELWETNDQELIENMIDEGEFNIYPSGGSGEYTINGWRARDMYNVVFVGDLQAQHAVGRDSNIGYNYDFELRET